MTIPAKRHIIRDMTVTEVSSVDRPAQKGAVAVLFKGEAVAIRKNAAEVAAGGAEPLYKAAEYGEAMMVRAGELGSQYGTTPERALLDHSGTDPVLIELACAERAAEIAIMKARNNRLFAPRAHLIPDGPTEKRTCLLCTKSFDSKRPSAPHQFCDVCSVG